MSTLSKFVYFKYTISLFNTEIPVFVEAKASITKATIRQTGESSSEERDVEIISVLSAFNHNVDYVYDLSNDDITAINSIAIDKLKEEYGL
jgi:hypothetical protein